MACQHPPSERRPVVLFVDDEAGLRDLAVETLEESGFEVVGAADGPEALEQLKLRSDICAMISDVRMPKMNGVMLAAVAQSQNPSLKIALITGYVGEAREIMDMDRWPVLLKPFDFERLSTLAVQMCA